MAHGRTEDCSDGTRGTPSALVLAAGPSSRFGGPKPLAELQGKPLIEWVLDAIPRAKVKETVVVLGRDAEVVAGAIGRRRGVRCVANRDYPEGMASSIRVGLSALARGTDGVLVLLADQPLVSRQLLLQLLSIFERATTTVIVAASSHKTVAPPAIFSKEYVPELNALRGDRGARSVIQSHLDCLVRVEVAAEVIMDIDTPEDLALARASLQSRESR